MTTMKMKVLDYSLLAILAGMAAPVAVAQDAPSREPSGQSQVQCGDAACTDNGEVLMRVRTRGEREPVTAGKDDATSTALQPDRRVTVETEVPGKAVATGKWSVQLPDGGAIWATEDPNLGQPELETEPEAEVDAEDERFFDQDHP